MIERVPIGAVRPNPNNPRLIKDEKYQKLLASLREFPEMLSLRPIVVNAEMTALGGNMRLAACKELKHKEVYIIRAENLTAEQQREFMIKDNLGYGEWDYAILANEWDPVQLDHWGLDIPGFDIDPDAMKDSFALPDGDKEPFQQMTFTLADEQVQVIKNAIEEMKKTDEYKYAETMGNENSNGNALYLIVAQWAGQRI